MGASEREADDLIEEYLSSEISKEPKEAMTNIVVVVTADRVLIQKCLHLGRAAPGVKILISSGK